MSIQAFIQQCQQQTDHALAQILPQPTGDAERLYEAMRYCVFNGGKRIRPALVYATAAAFNCAPEHCVDPACAVELIHSYSLIHDDLPAMDDDQLRRGKPTCHIAFDEATAILAGDALQTLAFEVLANSENHYTTDLNKLKMIASLAKSSGPSGMVAGQAIDLASTGKKLELEQLIRMHNCKTGALIVASVTLGALCTNQATPAQIEALNRYAIHIGLAFQIKDDILDVEGDTQTLGKQQGADEALDKPTYTSILGLDRARKEAQEQHRAALDALAIFGPEADRLRQLADFVIRRNK